MLEKDLAKKDITDQVSVAAPIDSEKMASEDREVPSISEGAAAAAAKVLGSVGRLKAFIQDFADPVKKPKPSPLRNSIPVPDSELEEEIGTQDYRNISLILAPVRRDTPPSTPPPPPTPPPSPAAAVAEAQGGIVRTHLPRPEVIFSADSAAVAEARGGIVNIWEDIPPSSIVTAAARSIVNIWEDIPPSSTVTAPTSLLGQERGPGLAQ